MKIKLKLGLLIVLMMFPQFVETIYSPALPFLATKFQITEATTLLTLSIYFVAFALGVLFWGIQSDFHGRRKTMIYGLMLYTAASILALIAPSFEMLIVARFLAAFGISVGSVVTQTMIRDVATGTTLIRIFSIMGVALSISPVIGLLLGGITANFFGYYGIFSLLVGLSFIILFKTVKDLPETKSNKTVFSFKDLIALAVQIYTDKYIWRFAILIMCYNVLLFSYYAFAPFLFKQAGYPSTIYGYSGIVLALGSFTGSYTNKKFTEKGFRPQRLISFASWFALFNSIAVYYLQHTLFFLVPTMLIVVSFGISIPNLLSMALLHYKSNIGSASALFGLLYYVLIGTAMFLTSSMSSLGAVLILCSLIASVLSLTFNLKKI